MQKPRMPKELEYNLLNAVDHGILQKYEQTWIPKAFYPSHATVKIGKTVIGKCMRQLYYNWTGVPRSNVRKLSTLWRFKLGDGIHIAIAGLIKKAGLVAASETGGKIEFPGLKHKVSYRLDNIIMLPVIFGAEIKSTYRQGYKNYTALVPKSSAFLQTAIYTFSKVPHWKIVVIDRGSADRIEWNLWRQENEFFVCPAQQPKSITRLQFTVEDIIKRWKLFEKYLKQKKLPPPDFKFDFHKNSDKPIKSHCDWRCINASGCCEYYDVCVAQQLKDRNGGTNARKRSTKILGDATV